MNILSLSDDVLLKIVLYLKKYPNCIQLYPCLFRLNKHINKIMTDKAVFRAIIFNYRDMCLDLFVEAHHQSNKYLELRAPWKQVKISKEQESSSATCLYVAINVLYKNALLLHPVMPTKVDLILEMLGQNCPTNIFDVELIAAGTKLGDGKSPFPRIDK